MSYRFLIARVAHKGVQITKLAKDSISTQKNQTLRFNPSKNKIHRIMPQNKPLINIAIFQRDIYLLAALLLADEKMKKYEETADVAAHDFEYEEIADVATHYFESEVNRLLISVAVFARQLLEIKPEMQKEICGTYQKKSQSESNDLRFHQACSKIIHAREIRPYNALYDIENTVTDRVFYTDKITILDEDGRDIVELAGMKFIKYCIKLSKYFIEVNNIIKGE